MVRTSICIPSNMPYVNNIWLPRKRGDRPPVVPEGVTNLGLMGQYVELERDIAFTFEYSTRTAWEAIYRLLKRGPAPPDVYQGQYRSEGRVGGYESVSGSDDDLGGEARARPGARGQSGGGPAGPRAAQCSTGPACGR